MLLVSMLALAGPGKGLETGPKTIPANPDVAGVWVQVAPTSRVPGPVKTGPGCWSTPCRRWTLPPSCGTRAKGRCRDNGPPSPYPDVSLSWCLAFASQAGAISTPQPGASVTVAWPPSMA